MVCAMDPNSSVIKRLWCIVLCIVFYCKKICLMIYKQQRYSCISAVGLSMSWFFTHIVHELCSSNSLDAKSSMDR